MEQLVTSNFKLGIIAGGQLGKLLSLAASNWDIKTYILDADKNCPASSSCNQLIIGNPLDYNDVYNFGKMVDLLSFEVENINIDALKRLKQEGKRILPDPELLELIKDKGLQKEFYKLYHIPTAPFLFADNPMEIKAKLMAKEIQFPFVQKLRVGGYDGKGVAVIKNEIDLNNLLPGKSIIEETIHIEKEISAIIARNENGETNCFPLVEMKFSSEANLVEMLICPSSLTDAQNRQALQLAEKIINKLNFCGLLAVEMFLDTKGKIWINEIAPRPHNSGHHTIESTITSQFEQMLRAIFNLPLGSTEVKKPSVMINLLGEKEYEGNVVYEGLTEIMKIEGVKIHLYGKQITKPFRKMGHITVLGNNVEEAIAKALLVKQKVKVKS